MMGYNSGTSIDVAGRCISTPGRGTTRHRRPVMQADSTAFPLSDKVVARFWRRVDRSGGPDACWPWTGTLSRKGYGRIGDGQPYSSFAHRRAWLFHNGTLPDGLCVCHRCDNPGCCNPAHLFLGTNRENVADRDAKGRTGRGERNRHAVLSRPEVAAIRAEYATGQTSYRRLAAKYGVNKSTIRRVVRRELWAFVQ